MPEDPRAVEAAAALQEGALRREVDLLRSRAQLLAAAGRVRLMAPLGARHCRAPWPCSIQSQGCMKTSLAMGVSPSVGLEGDAHMQPMMDACAGACGRNEGRCWTQLCFVRLRD